MMERSLVLILCVVVLASLVAGYAALSGRNQQRAQQLEVQRVRAASMDKFRSVPVRSLSLLKSDRRPIDHAVEKLVDLTLPQRTALLETVTGILTRRYEAADLRSWIREREQAGYVYRAPGDAKADKALEDVCKVLNIDRSTLSSDATEAWTSVLEKLDAVNNGRNRVVSVASNDAGWSIVSGRYSLALPMWPEHPIEVQERLGWGFTGSASLASPWSHPRGLAQQVEQFGSVTVASVLFKASFADGQDRNIGIMLVWDAAGGRWITHSVTVGTITTDPQDAAVILF